MSQLVFDDKERVGAWVAREVEHTAGWASFYAMGLEEGGELIAGVVFHQFNGSNAVVHIAIKRLSKRVIELLQHCHRYAFEQCKLRRLTGMVVASNVMALSVDRHMGFEDEFVMKCAGRDGEDMHVLVLWPENFRYKVEGV